MIAHAGELSLSIGAPVYEEEMGLATHDKILSGWVKKRAGWT